MSPCCSSHILWRCIILRDHSHHYPINGIFRWLERLAFLVLIWVDKQAGKQISHERGPAWTLQYCAATVPTQQCQQSETLLAMPISKDVMCVPNAQCFTRKCELKNLQLLSEVGESFQPPGAPPDFTMNSNLEARYAVVSQARCPLISWISCSKSWLPYYYISSMQL